MCELETWASADEGSARAINTARMVGRMTYSASEQWWLELCSLIAETAQCQLARPESALLPTTSGPQEAFWHGWLNRTRQLTHRLVQLACRPTEDIRKPSDVVISCRNHAQLRAAFGR